jgi:hypothetical protein
MPYINKFDMPALLDTALANIEANIRAESEQIQIAEVAKARPKRCEKADCKVKIMLSDFACKCTKYYCSQHRHAELHSCAFNFKELGHQNLEKQLIKVAGQKVDKI